MKCQSWVRRTGEACDHPAKYGILWVSQVKQGHGHKATDGRFVKIDNYACGHHLGRRRASKISIEHLNGTPDHDDLVALARYEEDLARQAKREEAFLRDYEQSVRANAIQKHHIVITQTGDEWRFDVVSDENGRSVGGVRVEPEAGVWQASVYSAVGSTGRGSGSVSHLRTLATALTDAADMIERNNEGVL